MDMREAAEGYCHIIEAAQGADRMTFENDVARTLSAAVAAAYRISDTELTSESSAEDSSDSITHDEWFSRMKDIQGVVHEWDNYWTTSTAYRLDEATRLPDLRIEFFQDNVANLSLSNDLADIWRDLRAGLNALNRGAPANEVAWGWRISFRTHWGAHASEALRALHQQLTG